MARNLLASYYTLAGDVSPLAPRSISPVPLRMRIEAAGKAGFGGIGLHQDDLDHALSSCSYLEIRHWLDDCGMAYREIELLRDWFVNGDRRAQASRQWARMFEAAELLRATHIKVAASGDDSSFDWITQCFVDLCGRAANAGTAIALEITPFGRIANLQDGITLIQSAGLANGGLLLDAWHVMRGGIDLTAVSRMPPNVLRFVELCDGPAVPREDYLQDTVNHRMQCGHGTFPLAAFLKAIGDSGYRGPYGVEILSETNRKAPLTRAAALAFEATATALSAVSSMP